MYAAIPVTDGRTKAESQARGQTMWAHEDVTEDEHRGATAGDKDNVVAESIYPGMLSLKTPTLVKAPADICQSSRRY